MHFFSTNLNEKSLPGMIKFLHLSGSIKGITPIKGRFQPLQERYPFEKMSSPLQRLKRIHIVIQCRLVKGFLPSQE